MNFVLGSAFSEGPDPGPGLLYKVWRSATENWSGGGWAYGGGWKETDELDDSTRFGWEVVVNNLTGSLRFELIVEQECENILLNQLQLSVAFLYPLKTFRCSDVFRGYRKAAPGCNGLK